MFNLVGPPSFLFPRRGGEAPSTYVKVPSAGSSQLHPISSQVLESHLLNSRRRSLVAISEDFRSHSQVIVGNVAPDRGGFPASVTYPKHCGSYCLEDTPERFLLRFKSFTDHITNLVDGLGPAGDLPSKDLVLALSLYSAGSDDPELIASPTLRQRVGNPGTTRLGNRVSNYHLTTIGTCPIGSTVCV